MIVEEVYESQHGLAVLPKMMICFDDDLVFKLKCRRESEASVKAADIYLLFGEQLLNKMYYIYIYIYIYASCCIPTLWISPACQGCHSVIKKTAERTTSVIESNHYMCLS